MPLQKPINPSLPYIFIGLPKTALKYGICAVNNLVALVRESTVSRFKEVIDKLLFFSSVSSVAKPHTQPLFGPPFTARCSVPTWYTIV